MSDRLTHYPILHLLPHLTFMTPKSTPFHIPPHQSSMPLLSNLYCHDETLDDSQHPLRPSSQSSQLDAARIGLSQLDLAWDDAELQLLLSKEEQMQIEMKNVDSEFVEVRREAVEWMVRVSSRFGFSDVGVVLGVSYFDMFFSGVGVKKRKPWMGQLTAVACLSLAAKLEEVAVPLLVDLQIDGAKYVFEAKTVQRMELLVLSSLKWKMSFVTPFSFLDHFFRRFALSKVHLSFLKMCDTLVVSLIADSRSLSYRPSMLAASTMLYLVQEFESMESFLIKEQLIDLLKLDNEKLYECCSLVSELSINRDQPCKFDSSAPSSPHGVIDMSFSCENSNDSWIATSSTVSSSLEPYSKRRRIQEQQMRPRAPFNCPGIP